MGRDMPILASEQRAARLLDLNLKQFRDMVEAGHLPRGREIAPGFVRWSVDDLQRIATGKAVDGMGDVSW